MQIILLHPRLSHARSLTLTSRHVVLATGMLLIALLLTTSLLSMLLVRYAAEYQLPFLAPAAAPDQSARQDRYVKENLAAMAVKLGAMQAQLMRLDALGERVQGLAGIKPEEFNFRELPGRGGAEPSAASAHMAPRVLDMAEFQRMLDALAKGVDQRTDYLNVVETALMTTQIKSRMLPTTQPVNVGYNASGFGLRIDPFTGRSTFHDGIDFPAPVGTLIIAAAGGVVIAAEYHHEFGNMLEIDHGNGIVTRYAHASRLLVKVGDIVRRGQHVAAIGTTGRSTGAHLHFEVLVKGIPQNPQKFLTAGADQTATLSQR
ncbi:MAG TPA: M23 family metallopeptidase [Burkholderiaceae bacterium]|nr:M23 family metallopeptidase [Burkholderiaceae bacterium]